MASFGVDLQEFEPPPANFNSYSLYEADLNHNPYLDPETESSVSGSLAQDIASLSIGRSSGYSGDESSAYSVSSQPSAYSDSPSPYDGSQGSSLATMPYNEEPTPSQLSRPSFGAPSLSFASLPTSDSYSMAVSDSYTTDPSSQPSQEAPSSGYAELSSGGAYDTYMAESDGAVGSYPYDASSSQNTAASSSSPAPGLLQSHRSSPKPPTPSVAPEPTGQLFKNDGRNWTRDFYNVQSTISKGGSALDTVEVMSKLSHMTAEFTEDAVKYGSVIIREQMLPPAKKTIKPVGVGGIAGGQKFVHAGIFFKFPTDDVGLYGNLENAMRGAGHELKGLTALINWELKTIGLHTIKFPLTAIIDYYGYRLVATAVLPLSNKTMCIGSGDAGKTVLDGTEAHQREPARRLGQLLADWGRYINVAPHDFQSTSLNRRIANVKICFDLEGHIGSDGNYYLCDFARTFPPADPMGVSGRFLYRLLRPEFVKKYRKPLSSDSFMSMQVDKAFNATTKDASKHLMTEWLIEAVKVWNRTVNCVLPPNIISLLAHQSGINLRFLRLVAAVVTDMNLKKAVNVEIIARTLKSIIRSEIRDSGRLDDESILSVIAKYFNLVFSDSEESSEFWDQELQREIYKRFEAPTTAFFNLADELLSAPATPSGSPAPSRSSSLLNSTSSSQDSEHSTSSPSLSTSKSRKSKSKAEPSLDFDPEEPVKRPAKRTPAKKSKAAPIATPEPSAIKHSDSTPSKATATPSEVPSARRSTRARKAVANPEPLPQWVLELDSADDEDFEPSSSESESSEDDESGESSNDEAPTDRYQTGYHDDFTAYGDTDSGYGELKPEPKPLKKPAAAKETAKKIAPVKTSPSSSQDASHVKTSSRGSNSAEATQQTPEMPQKTLSTETPSNAPRRSGRIPKKFENPEPLPEWVLQLDDAADMDYAESADEESSEEESDLSGTESDDEGAKPSNTGYSDDFSGYGEDERHSAQKKAPAKTKSKTKVFDSSPKAKAAGIKSKRSTPSKALDSASTTKTTYIDPRDVLGGSDAETPTPPMTPLRGSLSSNIASPLLRTPSTGFGTEVRVDRNLGILRHQVHLEMLYTRLQQLLGCFFSISGDAQFQGVMMHHNGDVKTKTIRATVGSKFGLSTASGSGVSAAASSNASSAPSSSSISLENSAEVAQNEAVQERVIEISAHPKLALTPSDVEVYRPRIKQMFLTPFQVAFSLKKQADETEDFDRREDLLRRASESYLECLERNTLGDFALHNASRVLLAWLPFFPDSNSNDAKCVAYLAKRFAVLAEKENRDLANFKADIYKTSDLIEPRTGKVLRAQQPEWSSESLIRNLVLRKTELAEMVADIRSNAQPSEDPNENSDMELRMALRDGYDIMFEEFAVDPSAKPNAKKTASAKATAAAAARTVVERRVALQYWKMLVSVIHPSNPEMLDRLVEGLNTLPKDKAFLQRKHWETAATFIF